MRRGDEGSLGGGEWEEVEGGVGGIGRGGGEKDGGREWG